MALQIPLLACFTCQKRISIYQERFRYLRLGRSTDEEKFVILDIANKYKDYERYLSNGDSSERAFNNIGEMKRFYQFNKMNETPIEASLIYQTYGIKRICCMRSISSPPIWPDYATEKPPGSLITIDDGTIKRYVKQVGSTFVKYQVNPEDGDDISNIGIIPEVEDINVEEIESYTMDQDIEELDV